jgi:hypothetical protein
MKNQVAFFAKLKLELNSKNLAPQIAQLLSISEDSAYRRINGKSILSLDEAYQITNHFNVSIGDYNEGGIFFKLQNSQSISSDFDGFTLALIQLFDSQNSKTQLYYTAKDIPFYYYALLPELAAFKLYYWASTTQLSANDKKNKFNLETISAEHHEQLKKVGDFFSNVQSSEIWNDETLNSILYQINYYYELDYFANNATAIKLYECLLSLLDVIETQCELGKKTKVDARLNTTPTEVDYHFYYNPILYLDNTIIIKKGDQLSQMVPYNAVDYMVTNNETFASKNYQWFGEQIKRSLCYSQNAEKERRLYFVKLRRKVQSFMALVR